MSPYGISQGSEKPQEEFKTAFDVSKKYLGLKMHVESLESCDGMSINNTIDELSAIYKDLTFLDDDGIYINLKKATELFKVENKDDKLAINDIGSAIYSVLSDSFKIQEDSQRLLIIESPLGSYKNRLLKNIYLKVATQELKNDVLPFYINVSKYEEER